MRVTLKISTTRQENSTIESVSAELELDKEADIDQDACQMLLTAATTKMLLATASQSQANILQAINDLQKTLAGKFSEMVDKSRETETIIGVKITELLSKSRETEVAITSQSSELMEIASKTETTIATQSSEINAILADVAKQGIQAANLGDILSNIDIKTLIEKSTATLHVEHTKNEEKN